MLTNDEVLAVNQNSTNNRQLFNTNNTVAWVADVPGSKDKYVALFNTSPAPARRPARAWHRVGQRMRRPLTPTATQPREISVSLADLGFTGTVKVRDLWNHKDLGSVTDKFARKPSTRTAPVFTG